MKFLAQLQTWEPLVLLQSWEQVPKRRHSLMSGQEGDGIRGHPTDPDSAPGTPFLPPQPHASCEITSHRQKTKPHSPIPSSRGKYLGKNSCLAPSGSLYGSCSRRWTGSGRSGPRPHTWWCWSCSRMTCALRWDTLSHACHSEFPSPQRAPGSPPTMGAGLFIRAISTVIEEVAAEVGADALLVPTQELVLVLAAALGLGRG